MLQGRWRRSALIFLVTAGAVMGLGAPAVAAPGDGCGDSACRAEVRRQIHERWRAKVAPYRDWLKRLADCESTGNPRAVSPDGTYLGLYQFDRRTWTEVGGRSGFRGVWTDWPGPLEQSYRAVVLRQRAGVGRWPVCG